MKGGNGWPLSERAKLVLELLPAEGGVTRAELNKLAHERLALNPAQVGCALNSLRSRKIVACDESTRGSHTWSRRPRP